MGRRLTNVTALISAIGVRLRTLYADVLNGKIPKRMTELATKLNQPKETYGPITGRAARPVPNALSMARAQTQLAAFAAARNSEGVMP